MKPESLIITEGFRTIRIDSFIEHLTKKPTCRITCAEECEDSIDVDGGWQCSDPQDASFLCNCRTDRPNNFKIARSSFFFYNNA